MTDHSPQSPPPWAPPTPPFPPHPTPHPPHQPPAPPPTLSYATTPPRRWGSLLGWVFFLGLAVLLFLLMSQRTTIPGGPPGSGPGSVNAPIPLSDFATRLDTKDVRMVTVHRSELRGQFVSPQSLPDGRTVVNFRTTLPEGMGESWPFLQYLLDRRGPATITVAPAETHNSFVSNILLPLIPWGVIFFLIWFTVIRQLQKHTKNQTLITGPGRWIPDPPK